MIDEQTRSSVIPLLPKNYRQIIAKQYHCHPNTVSNVLYGYHKNTKIAEALLLLAKKEAESRANIRALADQLSGDFKSSNRCL